MSSPREARPVRALRWLPAVAWMALIFVLSSQQGLAVTQDPGTEKPIRIVVHLATYGLLGALLVWALCGLRRPTGREVLAAIGLALLYALSDELHQALVPGRSGRLADVVIDFVGAVAGVALAAGLLTTLDGARSAGEPEAAGLDGAPSAGELEAAPFEAARLDAERQRP